MKKLIIPAILLLSVLVVSGCISPRPSSTTTTVRGVTTTSTVSVFECNFPCQPVVTTTTVCPPQPASRWCSEFGGDRVLCPEVSYHGGCTVRDCSLCEGVYITTTIPPVGMPNPASVFCQQSGGRVEIREDAERNQYGVCVFGSFPFETECEEWSYFYKCSPDAVRY